MSEPSGMSASDARPPLAGEHLPGDASTKRAAFLVAYAQTGNITAAAHAAKCSPSSHRHVWMKQADYPALFEEAKEQAVEMMEAEALRRATVGTAEPVFHQGKQVGTVMKKSDVLLIFLLKAARPQKYRERLSHELSGPNGGAIPIAGTITDELRAKANAVLTGADAIAAAVLLSERMALAAPVEPAKE